MRISPYSLVHVVAIVVSASAGAGCLFDPSLYERALDGGAASDGGALIDAGGNGSDGGAGGDAGAPSDGGSGALCGRTSPATLCPGSYLFCDGFEDENGQDFAHWSTWLADNLSGQAGNLGTNILVDDGAACLGRHALHASTAGGNQEAIVIRNLSNLPNPVYVRLFVLIKQHGTSSGLIEFRNQAGDYASLFVYAPTLSTPSSQFGFESSFSKALPTIGPEMMLDHNRWLCLELMTRFDTSTGGVALQLDGKPLGELTDLQTELRSAPMDRMVVGPISDDKGSPLLPNEIYVDEVAVSPTPIGCN